MPVTIIVTYIIVIIMFPIYVRYEMGQAKGTKTVRTYITATVLVAYPTVASLVRIRVYSHFNIYILWLAASVTMHMAA